MLRGWKLHNYRKEPNFQAQFSSCEEGDEPDYWVWETVPKPKPAGEDGGGVKDTAELGFPFLEALKSGSDGRDVTLRVLTESMSAHHIAGVLFTTEDYDVRRHRVEEQDWNMGPKPKPSFHLSEIDF